MRKKYLIIAMDMANLAAGIVFKRIISAMANYADCNVICPNMDEQANQLVNHLSCPPYKQMDLRLERRLRKLLGYNITEILWSRRTFKITRRLIKEGDYDAIISFAHGSNYASIILGKMLSEYVSKPWIVYSVDALPAPDFWGNNTIVREQKIKQIRRLLNQADALFMANPKMLKYELDVLGTFRGFSGVALTPCQLDYKESKNDLSQNKCVSFLYAGELYGPRNVESLIEGYRFFIKKHDESKLIFVGRDVQSLLSKYNDLIDSGRMECYEFTKELSTYYDRADVLLDINADIENDVFLSSKVCNYLSFDKPILTISQEGSPVRFLMSGVESIVHSHHKAEEICSAMQRAVALKGKHINDREELKRTFSPNEVAYKFNKEIEAILP